jgi:hypothetical protein
MDKGMDKVTELIYKVEHIRDELKEVSDALHTILPVKVGDDDGEY